MHACDISQYQNVLCSISPNTTLANISSYTVYITTIPQCDNYTSWYLLASGIFGESVSNRC